MAAGRNQTAGPMWQTGPSQVIRGANPPPVIPTPVTDQRPDRVQRAFRADPLNRLWPADADRMCTPAPGGSYTAFVIDTLGLIGSRADPHSPPWPPRRSPLHALIPRPWTPLPPRPPSTCPCASPEASTTPDSGPRSGPMEILLQTFSLNPVDGRYNKTELIHAHPGVTKIEFHGIC